MENIKLAGKDDWLVLYIAGCSESRTKHVIRRGGQQSNYFFVKLNGTYIDVGA